jgi:uncharacterized protein YuzE
MDKGIISKEVISHVFKATPHFLKMPASRMWIDYDREADVLYISFKRPQKATDSEMLENGILVRYRGSQVVGLTILEASKRDKKNTKSKVSH